MALTLAGSSLDCFLALSTCQLFPESGFILPPHPGCLQPICATPNNEFCFADGATTTWPNLHPTAPCEPPGVPCQSYMPALTRLLSPSPLYTPPVSTSHVPPPSTCWTRRFSTLSLAAPSAVMQVTPWSLTHSFELWEVTHGPPGGATSVPALGIAGYPHAPFSATHLPRSLFYVTRM